MRVKHINIRSTSMSTSEGPVEIDAEGFATVDGALADHILLNPFGFTAVDDAEAAALAAAAAAKAEEDSAAAAAKAVKEAEEAAAIAAKAAAAAAALELEQPTKKGKK
jgi:hypothetical protein